MSRLKYFLIRRAKSFKYAAKGLVFIFKTQPNFVIHTIAGALAVAMGFYFEISRSQWLVLVLTIGFVMFAESVNTAIEKICDRISPEFDREIGLIKDVAAASVLIAAISAIVVGLIIFLPQIAKLL